MLTTSSYPIDAEKQTRALPRPGNARDDEDRRAREAFELLLVAASRGQSSRASSIAEGLITRGYGVEPVGPFGFRLVVSAGRRAS